MELYLLTGILAVAAMWDLSYARIPNALITAGYMMAFCCVLMQKEGTVTDRLFGLVLPILPGLVFFALGKLGAGDIKLFSVVGAFLGVKAVLHCIGGAFAVGAVIGGVKIVIEAGRWRLYPRKVTIRFALPILCGTMAFLFRTYFR